MNGYSLERQRLHQQIVDNVFAQETASAPPLNNTENPHLIVIGGAPGGGKTTITKWIDKHKLLQYPYAAVDKDTFRVLPEFDTIFVANGRPHPKKSPELVNEYYHVRQLILERAAPARISVIIEDHLDSNLHPGNKRADKKLVDTAKTAGFKAVLLAMTITPFDYFSDWKVRNYQAEHVPYVFGVHKNLSQNWETICAMFDHSFLYQRNSSHGAYYDGVFYLSMIGEFQTRPKKQRIYGERKFERFKLWESVNDQGTELQTAFPRGQDEEHPDYERRVGGPGDGIPGEKITPGFVQRIVRMSRRAIE